VGGLFCFNFLNDKVNSEQSTPIGYNLHIGLIISSLFLKTNTKGGQTMKQETLEEAANGLRIYEVRQTINFKL